MPDVDNGTTGEGESLRAAYVGWKKSRSPSPTTLREFTYAIDRFIELHGDMPVEKITRKHVREFREALQELPVRRAGKLQRATLPELVEWSNEPEPDRAPWEPADLRVLFASSVFTEGARPKAGRGEAAFWLPLLGLFTGARLGEIAPLSAADVKTDELTSIHSIVITEDLEQGRRLKTSGSRRVVPMHPELVSIGFIEFVQRVRQKHGGKARLFPLLTRGRRGGYGERGRSGSDATFVN
jgi:integrase